MGKKKDKIPAPGGKSDKYTNFMSKAKWKAALGKSIVDLSGKNIQGPGALTVGNAVVRSKFVTYLDLSGNHLGDDGAIEFAQCLKTNDLLNQINLSNNEIRDIGGIALASAFVPNANPSGQPGQWNRSVVQLNLSGNLCKDDTLFAFCNAASCHLDLYQVDLQYNKIGPLGAKGYWRMMQRNTLCNFILHHNEIGDEGTQMLCAAWKRFGKTGSQNRLNLCSNDICQGGAEAVGDLVANNDFVLDVNLAWNTLGEKGMQLFTNKLAPPLGGGPQPKTVLAELNLSYCCLGDGGAYELAKLIGFNIETLLRLNASRNDIKDAGGTAIAKALMKNNFLHTINLSDNDFGDKAADAFYEAISETKVIQKISLRKSGFSDRQKDRLMTVAKNPPTVDLSSRDDIMLAEFLEKVTTWMEAHKPDENEGKKKKKGGKKKK